MQCDTLFSVPFLVISDVAFWLLQKFWNKSKILIRVNWYNSRVSTLIGDGQLRPTIIQGKFFPSSSLLPYEYHFTLSLFWIEFDIVSSTRSHSGVSFFYSVTKLFGVLKKGTFPTNTFRSLFPDRLRKFCFASLSTHPCKTPLEFHT